MDQQGMDQQGMDQQGMDQQGMDPPQDDVRLESTRATSTSTSPRSPMVLHVKIPGEIEEPSDDMDGDGDDTAQRENTDEHLAIPDTDADGEEFLDSEVAVVDLIDPAWDNERLREELIDALTELRSSRGQASMSAEAGLLLMSKYESHRVDWLVETAALEQDLQTSEIKRQEALHWANTLEKELDDQKKRHKGKTARLKATLADTQNEVTTLSRRVAALDAESASKDAMVVAHDALLERLRSVEGENATLRKEVHKLESNLWSVQSSPAQTQQTNDVEERLRQWAASRSASQFDLAVFDQVEELESEVTRLRDECVVLQKGRDEATLLLQATTAKLRVQFSEMLESKAAEFEVKLAEIATEADQERDVVSELRADKLSIERQLHVANVKITALQQSLMLAKEETQAVHDETLQMLNNKDAACKQEIREIMDVATRSIADAHERASQGAHDAAMSAFVKAQQTIQSLQKSVSQRNSGGTGLTRVGTPTNRTPKFGNPQTMPSTAASKLIATHNLLHGGNLPKSPAVAALAKSGGRVSMSPLMSPRRPRWAVGLAASNAFGPNSGTASASGASVGGFGGGGGNSVCSSVHSQDAPKDVTSFPEPHCQSRPHSISGSANLNYLQHGGDSTRDLHYTHGDSRPSSISSLPRTPTSRGSSRSGVSGLVHDAYAFDVMHSGDLLGIGSSQSGHTSPIVGVWGEGTSRPASCDSGAAQAYNPLHRRRGSSGGVWKVRDARFMAAAKAAFTAQAYAAANGTNTEMRDWCSDLRPEQGGGSYDVGNVGNIGGVGNVGNVGDDNDPDGSLGGIDDLDVRVGSSALLGIVATDVCTALAVDGSDGDDGVELSRETPETQGSGCNGGSTSGSGSRSGSLGTQGGGDGANRRSSSISTVQAIGCNGSTHLDVSNTRRSSVENAGDDDGGVVGAIDNDHGMCGDAAGIQHAASSQHARMLGPVQSKDVVKDLWDQFADIVVTEQGGGHGGHGGQGQGASKLAWALNERRGVSGIDGIDVVGVNDSETGVMDAWCNAEVASIGGVGVGGGGVARATASNADLDMLVNVHKPWPDQKH